MSKLHNFPRSEVGHLNIQTGAFAGTVTKTFNCLAGAYQMCIAVSASTVQLSSTVQVFPYANEDQTAVGSAYEFKIDGGTFDGTVTIATGTNALVEFTDDEIFMPFGAQIVFSTTGTGNANIDFFARTEG